MPSDIKHLAEQDLAFPIGYGQTISQPLTVAFMLEKLQPNLGDKILDIGSGSGWTSALLAYIVSQKANPKSKITNSKQITNSKIQNLQGKVIAIEIIPELKEFGESNVLEYNFIEKGILKFVCADGSKGYKEQAPYDKILVSASASVGKIPQEWKDQLKVGGRIVAPIESSIWVFIKKSDKEFDEQEYPDFAFVPLIENND
jgi:protein-L-isoaspartate(D-aspartate) O-methyltransferase